jgi:uncharacterized protein
MSGSLPVLTGATAALLGAWVGGRLRLPGGPVLGALLAVVGVTAAGLETSAPEGIRFLALATIGLMLGEQFDRETVTSVRNALGPIALSLLTIAATVAVLAVLLGRWFGLDPATAVLVSVPGGFSSVVALSIATGADVLAVTVVHQLRVLLVIGTVPLVLRIVLRRRRAP